MQACARSLLEGKLGHDATDDVTNIGQALLQVFIRDFVEDFRVVFQCFLKRGPGIDFLVEDDGFDFGVQGRMAQKKAMPPENGRFILAQLLSHAHHDSVQFLGGSSDGVFKAAHFAGERGPVQMAQFALCQNLIHAIGPGHHDPRRDRYTF